MDTNPKQYLPLFIILLTILITSNSSKALEQDKNLYSTMDHVFPIGVKITVEIINDLGNGMNLQYHCKSGDDDFGDQSLGSGESWLFRFRRQFFGRTLYYCKFNWVNDEGHWFDIYKDKRDSSGDNWCEKCRWKIRESGPCRLSEVTKQFDLCYPWNKSLY